MSNPVRNETEGDEIDLLALFGVLYARKYTLLFITLIATGIGVANALVSTPVYQASALIQLEEKSGGLALSAEMSGLFTEQTQSVTEIEIIKSRMVLGEVAKNLNLDWFATPKRLPIIGDFLTRYHVPDPEWDYISEYAWSNEEIVLGFIEVPADLADRPLVLTSLGEGAFEVNVKGQTLGGNVGTTLRNEELGFAILIDRLNGKAGRKFSVGRNSLTIAAQSLQRNLSIREKGARSSILQLTLTGGDPREIVEILDEITEVYLLQNLSRNAAEAENSLAFIRKQLPETQEQVRLAEEALNAFKSSRASIDLSFETRSLLESAVVIEAQLNALVLEEQDLQKRYTESHPAYQTLLENRAQLVTRLAAITAQTTDLPETQQQVLRFSQDVEVAQQIYLQLLNRAQELNVVNAGIISNIRIIDTALAVPYPIAPNKRNIVLLATILGLVSAGGYVLARSFLVHGVQSVEEIEQLSIPVYATIPKVGNGDYEGAVNKKGSRTILAKKEPTNMTVEAIRSLRTSLHFGMLDAKSSLCMITSARPTEGKSFLSVNLAVVMAQAGQNICLVDVDIRRGYLNRFFGISRSTPGLTDVLAGEALIEDVIVKDEDSGLYFIPVGKFPPNPSELLMHKRFEEVLDYLNNRFDMSILDTPPLLAVTDPAIVGRYAGMILLAVRHEVTSIAEVRASQKLLENSGLKITGAVLNAYDLKKNRYGYGGYYGASYQYEYKSRKA